MNAPACGHIRSGLSRVEVAVVFGITVILGGFLLTAVGNVREAAASAQCKNNFKQLTIAALNYHDVHGRLPPLVDQGDGAPTGGGLPSAFWTISPYLESQPVLYRPGQFPPAAYHADSSVPFTYHNKDGSTGTAYGGVANQVCRTFLCPADNTASRLRDVKVKLPDGSTGHYATGSYSANGLLPWRTGLPRDAVTVLLAERPQVCRTAAGETVHNLWGVGFYSPQMPAFAALTPADPPGLWTTGQVAPVLPLPDRDELIRVRIGTWDALPQPPDFPTPIQRIGSRRPCDPRLPGTSHRGGLQVAMSDVSVRVFSPGISPWVFWAACVPPAPSPKQPANE